MASNPQLMPWQELDPKSTETKNFGAPLRPSSSTGSSYRGLNTNFDKVMGPAILSFQ